MNILHMKYAVEVARFGSLSAASESLIIAQPNLSRAIKSLESDLGITIFDRSPKGMILTAEGEEFIGYAQGILDKIEDVEAIYRLGMTEKNKFSVSVPRSDHISRAFVRLSADMKSSAELVFRESDALDTINSVLRTDCKLGIIRYADIYDKQFKAMLREKGLICEAIAEFRPCIIMSADCPISALSEIRLSDLQSCIEVSYGDHFVPAMSVDEVKNNETTSGTVGKIYVCDRASALDLIAGRADTFMRSSAISDKMLSRYRLVMRDCVDDRRLWRDVCIYRKGYRLTEVDRRFLDGLMA